LIPNTNGTKGPQIHERLARVFVEQVLQRQPKGFLTLSNAYLIFCEYLSGKSMVPVKRTIFKGMFCPLVRDVLNVGLPHDIINPQTQKHGDGWKAIRALDLQAGALAQ
jgi:hypothetical protein